MFFGRQHASKVLSIHEGLHWERRKRFSQVPLSSLSSTFSSGGTFMEDVLRSYLFQGDHVMFQGDMYQPVSCSDDMATIL